MVKKKAAKKASRKKATQKVTKKSSAKKAVVKKAAKKPVVSHDDAQHLIDEVAQERTQKNIGWQRHLPLALLIIGAVLLIVGGFYLLNTHLLNSQEDVVTGDVAAVVNGVPITQEQLNTQYAILPEEYRESFTQADILEQLINEELIIQHAKEEGVEVEPASVNEEIQSVLAQGDLTIYELEQNLAEFGLTIEHFESMVERKIFIEEGTALMTQDLESPSREDARAFYEENQGEFIQPREVNVQHVLIASQRDNAAVLARDIRDRVNEGEDFCSLVEEYSDDQGSVDSCGEYTFPRGFMVAEFEQASFNMSINETTLVQTSFGYHIIRKLDDFPAGSSSFEDVEEDIIQELRNQQRTQVFESFITRAREEAVIEHP